jgi:hypothetical protein
MNTGDRIASTGPMPPRIIDALRRASSRGSFSRKW